MEIMQILEWAYSLEQMEFDVFEVYKHSRKKVSVFVFGKLL